MKHIEQFPQAREGFTFAEIAIAMLILALGLIPVFYVFSRSNAGTMLAREEILAHQLASEMIDSATELGYEDPRLAPGQVDASQLPQAGPGDSRFQRALQVSEITPAGGWKNWPMSYKVLTARVSWDSAGVVKVFSLTGLLYKGVASAP